MTQDARKPPPGHTTPGSPRRRGARALSRRLRQHLAEVDWRDVAAATAVQSCLDALGGDEALTELVYLIRILLLGDQ
jgi:hypothetical protein